MITTSLVCGLEVNTIIGIDFLYHNLFDIVRVIWRTDGQVLTIAVHILNSIAIAAIKVIALLDCFSDRSLRTQLLDLPYVGLIALSRDDIWVFSTT
jgi:hypothetical protein